MNHTRAPSPLATARPKNSSSSIASQHQEQQQQQQRGSTPTSSRSPAQAGAAEGRPGRAASKDSLKQKMAKAETSKADEVRLLLLPANNGTRKAASANPVQQLQVLRTEFDSLRAHLTCKICDRLLYQPYTIACGHTYCYSVSTAVHLTFIRC